MKKAILLVNVGTPDRPEVKAVRRYLAEFLSDPRVIDIGWLGRMLLVNLIIVPFRAPKSTLLYKKLWTDSGSPLSIHLNHLVKKIQTKMGQEVTVFGAMRYANPGLKKVLAEIQQKGFDEIVVMPLYPQYASSTTGSVFEYVCAEVKTWDAIPQIRFVGQFYQHPAFLNAFEKRIKAYRPETFDHVVFSYHGLPVRQVQKIHQGNDESNCTCHLAMPAHGMFCYKAACYETTRQLALRLGLSTDGFTSSFQSRMSKNWLSPFTDQVLSHLARQGRKKVLVVSPSFVADCLETLIEVNEEYKKIFTENGGEELVLVESLNSCDDWVNAISEIITSK
jgi:ferrochelatase